MHRGGSVFVECLCNLNASLRPMRRSCSIADHGLRPVLDEPWRVEMVVVQTQRLNHTKAYEKMPLRKLIAGARLWCIHSTELHCIACLYQRRRQDSKFAFSPPTCGRKPSLLHPLASWSRGNWIRRTVESTAQNNMTSIRSLIVIWSLCNGEPGLHDPTFGPILQVSSIKLTIRESDSVWDGGTVMKTIKLKIMNGTCRYLGC